MSNAAVDYATAQLGKPYVWAAAGPNSFDCSGLTMRAWQAAGQSLTHFTVAQYAETQHKPIEQATPGDLIFWMDNTGYIHHVAIYIGGGQVIEAPTDGIPVRQRAISVTESEIMKTVGALPASAGGGQAGSASVPGGATAAPVGGPSIQTIGQITGGVQPASWSNLLPWNWGKDLSAAQAGLVQSVTSFTLKLAFIGGGVGLVLLGAYRAAAPARDAINQQLS
jgi:hypothetical protein